jgi:hypothetical protein
LTGSDSHIYELYKITGGLPREMTFLQQFVNEMKELTPTQNLEFHDVRTKWVDERSKEIETQISRWDKNNEAELERWKLFLKDLLKSFREEKPLSKNPVGTQKTLRKTTINTL